MQVVFLTLLLAALTAAFSRGGRPERMGAGLLFVASVVTPMVQRHLFDQVEVSIAVVDFLLFGALAWMALASSRRWPVYAAAFQGLGVLTHLARFKAGAVSGDAYAHMLVAWSYLVVASLFLGSLMETQQQVVIDGPSEHDIEPVPPLLTNGIMSATNQSALELEEHALLARLLALHGLGPGSDEVAERLLFHAGSFAAAVAASPSLIAAWGMDQTVLDALALARHTARTLLKRKLETRPCLADQQQVVDYLYVELAHQTVEQFRVLYLNSRQRLIYEEIHGKGTVNAAPVFPREIVKRAIEVGAVELILAHNHPGGDPTASRSDIQTTRAVINAVRSIDVDVIDHIVISSSGHVSMRAAGLI